MDVKSVLEACGFSFHQNCETEALVRKQQHDAEMHHVH